MFALNGEIPLGLPLRQKDQQQQPQPQTEDCGTSRFIPEQRVWHNPLNWKTTAEENPTFVPYLERVPCKEDDVIFPDVKTFYCNKISNEWTPSGVTGFYFFNENLNLESILFISRLSPPSLSANLPSLSVNPFMTEEKCFFEKN